MKLTKENVYINLQGKTKEELTDLWEFLNNAEEKQYYDKEKFINENYYNILLLDEDNEWSLCLEISIMLEDKTEVTIEQLKEIIKPMENKEEQLIKEAKERGFLTEGNEFYSCFNDGNKIRVIKPYCSNSEINLYLDKSGSLRYYDGLNNEYDESLCSNPAIYKDGVWAKIVSGTLEQQLQKAEAEVKRLKEAIEDSKNKVGSWCKFWDNNKDEFVIGKLQMNIFDTYTTSGKNFLNCENITDSVLLESLNKLFKH